MELRRMTFALGSWALGPRPLIAFFPAGPACGEIPRQALHRRVAMLRGVVQGIKRRASSLPSVPKVSLGTVL
ncbi:hypothetical protein HD554DRAFT_2057565 [Boletus coccyginus]|nr:hypothetical protein HD554DRAFT_2057565 [Boletus coccyginus]